MTDQIQNAAASAEPPLLEVNDLKKHFPLSKGLLLRKSGKVYAVDGVSFHINQGETLGLVGESGCGKSTVGRTVLRLLNPTDGSIKLNGRDITHLSKTEMRP
ncbi:MAG: ABC transporter ATP-binding protein, partial [Alphaproteobacteria bacterium]|nr:ABC transporter ATP-binding protein [Alphaproteobacteria bacterium]